MLLGNRYQLEEKLGSGAMGKVYRALDRLTGQTIALKQVLLSPDELVFNARLSHSSVDAHVSLANEFQTLASLRHPNIISVQDYGFSSNLQPFFTMSLLENPKTLIQAGYGQPLIVQVHLLIQVLQALAYVHQRSILHRDLKPSNVLVKDGHVYVLDFGLASERDKQTGEVAGTIAYMAPEILSGGTADVVSDLYAVGVMAYEMIAGENPFMTDDITASIVRIIQHHADLEKLDVSLMLSTVIGRLLSKSPDDRYASASETIRAICDAAEIPVPQETEAIRSSFLQSADFVGREAELNLLKDSLKNLLGKQGSSWLIGGESGVGKSRLVNEFAIRAMVKGVMVLRGQAVAEGGVAYQIWREILRRIALFVEFTDDEFGILKIIIPDIELLVNRTALPVPDLPPQDLRARISLLIATAFRRASEQQPILLILEDLQWIQDIQLLQDTLPVFSTMPVMVIGSFRDDEMPNLPAQFAPLQLISLKRLTQEEIARLSVSMLGEAGQQAQVIDLLHRETEGNVFFLIEVVRTLAEDAGRLSEIGKVTLPAQIFAGGIQRVVDFRLNRVPDWAMPMVNLSAVAGRQIDPLLVQTLDPQLNLDNWLAACTNITIFSVQDGIYLFAHDKLREGLLNRFNEDESQDLHRRVAEAIETAYAGSLDNFAGILTHHYAIALNEQKEGYYAGIAALNSYERQNYPDAIVLFQRALALRAYEQAHDPRKKQADFLHGLGLALYGVSDYDNAREYQYKALEIYEELQDQLGISDALNGIGETRMRQALYQDARDKLQQALDIRLKLGNLKHIGYSYMNLGVVAAQTGQYEESRHLFEQCYALMQQDGEPVAIGRAMNNLAISYDLDGEIEKARAMYEASLELRRGINDRQGMGYSLMNWGMLEESLDNLEVAEAYLNEAYAMLKPLGQLASIATVLSSLAVIARRHQNLDEAEQYEQQALMMRRTIGDVNGTVTSLQGMGLILQAKEDYEGALGFFRQMLKLALDIQHEMNRRQAFCSIAEIYIKLNRREEAAQMVYAAFREGIGQNFQDRWDVLRMGLTEFADEGHTVEELAAKILLD